MMNNEVNMNEREHESEINDDRDGLGPRCFGPLAIGSVDQVNGKNSLPCPDYVATRHELLELVRYWLNQVLSIETTFYYERQIGSDDWRIAEYGKRRLDRITKLLGWTAVEPVVSAIEDRYRQEMGDRDWATFKGEPDDDDKVDALFAKKNAAQGHGDGQ